MRRLHREGNMCVFFNNGFGCCCKNGSRCDNPFSNEGCKIQCERIFKKEFKEGGPLQYKPLEENNTMTKDEVWKRIGIKKGDLVADYFMPYIEFETNGVEPSILIDFVWDMVERKILNEGLPRIAAQFRLFQNVEMFDQAGMYVIGVVRDD